MRWLLAAVLLVAGAAQVGAAPATVTRDVAYGGLDRQRLDVYVPAGVADDAPALVFFYGGGWQGGSKQDLAATAELLAAAGMIVAIPDYRLYPDAVFPQFVADCAAAVARVRRLLADLGGRHALFVGGHSAGAFNAAMLAADERYLDRRRRAAAAVAGYVLLSGPYEMSGHLPAPYAAIFPAATRDRASVAAFIDGGEPPLLLMSVAADSVVDPRASDRLAGVVMAHGGRAIVATYAGSDHIATFVGLSHPASAVRKDLAAFIAAVSAP